MFVIFEYGCDVCYFLGIREFVIGEEIVYYKCKVISSNWNCLFNGISWYVIRVSSNVVGKGFDIFDDKFCCNWGNGEEFVVRFFWSDK